MEPFSEPPMSDESATTKIEPSQSDSALIQAFSRDRSEPAFAALVGRHAGWLYAAAYRQLGDHHLAEDATQAVFVLLSQRASRMKPKQKLSGWLFLTLGYTVKSITRSRRRREHHEKLAASQRSEIPSAAGVLTGELDGAVALLPRKYQAAILLRFYQGLEIPTIAQQLQISEAATRKRIERALDQLRRASVPRPAPRRSPPPPSSARRKICGRFARLTRASLAAPGSSISSGASLAAKGAANLMLAANLKLALLLLLLALLTAAPASLAIWYFETAPPPPPSVPAAVAPIPTPAPRIALTPDQQILEQTYGLLPGETVRWIKPPFIKQRPLIYAKIPFSETPSTFMLWDNKNATFGIWVWSYPSLQPGDHLNMRTIATFLLRLGDYQVEGDKQLLSTRLPGDFSCDPSASAQQRTDALQKIFSQAAGYPLTLTFRQVDRPVVVFTGIWHSVLGSQRHPVQIFGLSLGGDPKTDRNFTQYPGDWNDELGDWLNEQVLFEAHRLPRSIDFHTNSIGDGSPAAKAHAHDLKLICDHIAQQTGLTWTEETRTVRRLFIERAP